jgi:hypothetical protein
MWAAMPRKIPSSYLRKLNEEQKRSKIFAAKAAEKKLEPRDPDSGKIKGFTGICQTCGTRTKFTVDRFGYATCGNCKAIASYKFGHVA